MVLPWGPARIGNGPPILTSLTDAEASELRRLAGGAPRVLEIGAAYGYSTVVLAQTAQLVVSIDPHEQMGSLLEFKRNITEYGIKDRVLMSIGDSKQVLPQLIGTNMRFNLVFIDGDHHYEAVKADIANAKHLLCPSGVIACHDYHEDTCPEVAPAIDELLPNGKLVADTLWVCRSFPS